MKVLQAIIISLLAVGCATEGEAEQKYLVGGGGDIQNPDYTPMQDGGECATVCPAGEQGAPGEPGAPGAQGVPGTDGVDGSSCSVTQDSNNATVSCTDGTSATLEGGVGVPGPAGPQGPMGPAGPAGAPGSPGPAGAMGAVGPAGSEGPAGADGQNGSDGLLTAGMLYTTLGQSFINSGNTYNWVHAECDEGDFAIGGGCSNANYAAKGSLPMLDPDDPAGAPLGWSCDFPGIAGNSSARAICVDVTP